MSDKVKISLRRLDINGRYDPKYLIISGPDGVRGIYELSYETPDGEVIEDGEVIGKVHRQLLDSKGNCTNWSRKPQEFPSALEIEIDVDSD